MTTLPLFYSDQYVDWVQIKKLSETVRTYDNEYKVPPITQTILQDIFQCSQDFAEELGFDLSIRLPNPSQVHFFSAEEFEIARAKTYKNDSSDALAFTGCLFREIFVTSSSPPDFVACKLVQHELVHLFSYTKIVIDINKTVDYVFRGYSQGSYHHSFLVFNEALVELTANYIGKNYWPKNKRLLDLIMSLEEPIHVYYTFHVILIDLIIQKISRVSQKTYIEVLNTLQRFLFSDPLSGYEYLKIHLGEKAVEVLEHLDGAPLKNMEYVDELKDLCDSLSLDVEFSGAMKEDSAYNFFKRIDLKRF